MQMSVEELFIQTEREYEFDSGFNQGFNQGYNQGMKEAKDEIILNMLEDSVDEELIIKFTHCTKQHLQELKKVIR